MIINWCREFIFNIINNYDINNKFAVKFAPDIELAFSNQSDVRSINHSSFNSP